MFYKGQTNDVSARLKRHNSRLEKATQSGAPWILIWSTVKQSRKEAIALELKLKNLDQNRLVKLMLKYSDDVVGPDAMTLLRQWSEC